MAKLNLSSPWAIFAEEVKALFEQDPGVHVVYDNDAVELKLYVDGEEKAEALTKLLPAEKDFGSIKMKIKVLPSNALFSEAAALFSKAFEGNPALSCVTNGDNIITSDFNYIVFQNKVVQFYVDDLGDYNGLCSTLYEDIAMDVFGEIPGVFYCTAKA